VGLAETASLIVDMQLKGGFGRALAKNIKALNSFDSKLQYTESRTRRAGQQIGTGIRRGAALAAGGLSFLAGNVALGLDSLIELEKQTAQTNAVLKSTKGAAGITAQAVGQLAEKFEGLNATIGDEVIRSSENMLLTFTNIRGKAFEPALKAVLDLNTAMGNGPEGLTKTAIQVGKALNDPSIGLTALRKVGVSFTKEQIKRIKTLQKEGKLYEAQKIILGELNKEFGGSFSKQGATTAGRIAKFRDSVEDLQRALAKALLPTLGNVADELTRFLADPAVIKGVEDLGKQIAGVFSKENLGNAGRILGDIFTEAKAAAPGIIAAAKTAGSVIATAVKLFQSLPPEIQRLAIGGAAINKLTGGLVTNLAGGLIGAVLKQLAAGVVNVNGGVVNVNGAGGIPGAAGAAGKGLSGVAKVALVGEAIGLAALVGAVQQDLSNQSSQHAQTIQGTQKTYLANSPTTDALKNSLAGVREGINQLTSNPLNVLVQGDALTRLQQMEADLSAELARRNKDTLPGKSGKLKDDLVVPLTKTTTAVDTMREALAGKLADDTAAVTASKDAITASVNANKDKISTTSAAIQATTRSATLSGANITAYAMRSAGAAIVSAIYAARPVINVNNVTRYQTIQSRYGPGQDSSGQQTHHAANGGA
jgi:hypothetical protein